MLPRRQIHKHPYARQMNAADGPYKESNISNILSFLLVTTTFPKHNPSTTLPFVPCLSQRTTMGGEEKPPPVLMLPSDPQQEQQQQQQPLPQQQLHQQQPISAPNSPSYFSQPVNPSQPFFTAAPGPTHTPGFGTEYNGGQGSSSAGANNIYTSNSTFSIPSIIAMNGSSGSTPFQPQVSGVLHSNTFSGIANPTRSSMSISPSHNFSNVMQHHKFRSPSLPVNTLGTSIELPQLTSISVVEAHSFLQNEPELTLFVDIRPFTLYSKSRVQSAVNVCIPTTLLKRPTFVLARFAECMIPAQRDAIEHLDRYNSVVIYDQATEEVSPSTCSPAPLIYTILKFSRSPSLQGKLYYIQGGFQSFEKEFADSVDQSAIVAERYNSSNISNSGSGSNTSSKPAGKHGYSNSQPTNSPLTHTFNFPPVLTGFSLPTNSTKDGPMKPFASNIRSSLDGIDVDDEVAPVSIPKDLAPEEVNACFPLWLQDIINKDTGPRNIFRRFHDIEEAEKVRLQSAFSRGTSMLNTGNTTPTITTTGGSSSTGRLLDVGSPSPLASLSPTTPGGGHIKYSFSAGVELGSKNRYNNIWPYDHTRVKVPELSASTTATGAAPTNGTASHDPRNTLTTHTTNTTILYYDDTKTTNATNESQLNYNNYEKSRSGSGDYFNASYITTKGTKMRYIATQGPLPDTFTDFWHVVWAKRIPVIVMLTAEAEGGSIKCHRYWNDGVYGGIALRLVTADSVVLSERTGTCVTIRKFELVPVSIEGATGTKVEGDSNGARHTVVQVQYTAWPDLGSPANPEDLIALCMLKNKYLESWMQENTVSADNELLPWTIVHCSAGCGRTGTFCTVDSVISLLKDQAKNNPAETPFHNTAAITSAMPAAGSEGKRENGQMAATDKGSGVTNTTGYDNVESHDLIYRTVHNFRRQRLSMVQVLRQYVLCYETVILWIHNQCGPAKHDQSTPRQLQGLLPQFQDERPNK